MRRRLVQTSVFRVQNIDLSIAVLFLSLKPILSVANLFFQPKKQYTLVHYTNPCKCKFWPGSIDSRKFKLSHTITSYTAKADFLRIKTSCTCSSHTKMTITGC